MRFLLMLFAINLLMGCQEPSRTEHIVLPASKASNFETNDSSFLKIKIADTTYNISLLKKELVIKDNNALDSFLQNNSNQINKQKVLVVGYTNTTKDKEFRNVLSRYGINKFRMNTK